MNLQIWQERCEEIINFLQQHFKETRYRICFSKNKEEWQFSVESIRNDSGSHDGTAISWIHVSAKDVESLPEKLMLKAQKIVLEWQEKGMETIRKIGEELQKARVELDKRLLLTDELDKIRLKQGSPHENCS